jgi:hypothetical protein
MEYRGKHYIVVQGIEPDSWKWTVELDERAFKSGESQNPGHGYKRPCAVH